MNFDEKAAEVIFHNSKTTLFCLYGSNKETAAPFLAALETASHSLKGTVLMSESDVT